MAKITSPRPHTYVRPAKTPEQALNLLMNLCAKSEKCLSDARKSLYRWGVDPEAYDKILSTLTSERFIDESRYAAAYVREKATLSRWGSYKIRAGLRAKQIPETVIAEAFAQLDDRAMEGKLEEQLRRKMRTIKAKNSYDLKSKLLRYGTGLGFDFSEVGELVDKLVKGGDEDF